MERSNVVEKLIRVLEEHREGVPQSWLARALGISKSYLSQILRDLESKGLIQRTRVGPTFVVKLVRRGAPPPRNVLKLGIVWSSEYLFLAPFAKLLRDRLGLELGVEIYPSAIEATYALVKGDLHAVLSPLVTQLLAAIATKSLIIVAGGAYGGSAIYELPRGEGVGCSELSAMDLCRVLASRSNMIDSEPVTYFSNPSQALEMARKNRVKYLAVWHPLTVEVSRYAKRVVIQCSEFEELRYCCTLALAKSLDLDLVEKIRSIYIESIEMFRKRPELYLDWYSSLTGIHIDVLRKALEEYGFEPELDRRTVDRVAKSMGFAVPHPSTVSRYVLT